MYDLILIYYFNLSRINIINNYRLLNKNNLVIQNFGKLNNIIADINHHNQGQSKPQTNNTGHVTQILIQQNLKLLRENHDRGIWYHHRDNSLICLGTFRQ